VVTLVHGHEIDGDAEHQALDHAFPDVVQVHGILRLRPVGARVHAHLLHADELRAVQRDHRERGGQQRHGDETAEEARHHHVAHRVHRHHLHGRELLGGLHEPDFRGQRRAGAAREQQRRQHRAQHLEIAERGEHADVVLRAEALEDIETQQAEHHADEHAGQHDDDQRAGAGVVDLPHDEARTRQRRTDARQDLHEEQRYRAHAAHGHDRQRVGGGVHRETSASPNNSAR
jgi:hypothetical protein